MDMIRARIDLVEAERRLKFLETQPEYTMDVREMPVSPRPHPGFHCVFQSIKSIQQLIDKGLCLIENANLFGDEPDNASKHLMDDIFLYRQVRPIIAPQIAPFQNLLIFFLQKLAQPSHVVAEGLLGC